jgi:hypothetical protein
MATLHLRDVPPDVQAALLAAARARGVSEERCAIEALRRGLGLDELDCSGLVDAIRRGRRPLEVDAAELIREDRPAERD